MAGPEQDVLDAFRLNGTPTPLVGGEDRSYRAGDAVLKPAEPDAAAATWLAETVASIREDGFRVARPLRTVTGAWAHEAGLPDVTSRVRRPTLRRKPGGSRSWRQGKLSNARSPIYPGLASWTGAPTRGGSVIRLLGRTGRRTVLRLGCVNRTRCWSSASTRCRRIALR